MFWASLIVFGLKINLSIILYIFVGVGVFTFLVCLLNLLFRKNKFNSPKNQDPDWLKKRDFAQAQENLDNEILSVLKNQKERTLHD